MHKLLLILVLAFFGGVPLAFLFYGAGGAAQGGIVVLSLLIAVQAPFFLCLYLLQKLVAKFKVSQTELELEEGGSP